MQLYLLQFYFAALLLISSIEAAVLTLTLAKTAPRNVEKFGYLEFKPNGTLILQSPPEFNTDNGQNLLLLRSVLNALKLAPLIMPGETKLNFKIYGDGVEHKFPPMLENFIQRIQNYFSVYRYTDTSRPVRKDEQTTENGAITTVKAINLNSNVENVDFITVGEEDAYITVGED